MSKKEVLASVAGRVMVCHVGRGDVLSVGDAVVTIESMKLEIPIESEVCGQVDDLKINAGDDVQEGQVLAILV